MGRGGRGPSARTRAARTPSGLRRAAFSLLCLLAGCSGGWGPNRFPAATATGRLTLDGAPVRRGWLELMPINGTVGNLRSAEVRPDGSFAARGVPVGTVAIRLVGSERLPSDDPRVRDFLARVRQQYLIERPIPPAGARLVIDLAEEARAGASGP